MKTPFYIKWIAHILAKHMADQQIATYEVQGMVNWKAKSGICNINADASNIIQCMLSSCGHELSPHSVKEKYNLIK